LLTTERTPTLNIEWGQINPKAGGGCNIDLGQNDSKATQGLNRSSISHNLWFWCLEASVLHGSVF